MSGKRILSLDTNLDFVEGLGQLLKDSGYESLVSTSESWALRILRTSSIDLFTQNLAREGMGGWGFLRKMKSDPVLQHIPVLIISVATRDTQTDVAKRYGVDFDCDVAGYIEKPIDYPEFLETIRKCLV